MKAYIAGPLRTADQRSALELIDTTVKKIGFTTWLPHRDIGIIPKSSVTSPMQLSSLRKNLEALHDSRVGIFLIDEESAGTSLELGYAFCLKTAIGMNIDIIGFSTEARPSDHTDSMTKYCLLSQGTLIRNMADLENHLFILFQSQNL